MPTLRRFRLNLAHGVPAGIVGTGWSNPSLPRRSVSIASFSYCYAENPLPAITTAVEAGSTSGSFFFLFALYPLIYPHYVFAGYPQWQLHCGGGRHRYTGKLTGAARFAFRGLGLPGWAGCACASTLLYSVILVDFLSTACCMPRASQLLLACTGDPLLRQH